MDGDTETRRDMGGEEAIIFYTPFGTFLCTTSSLLGGKIFLVRVIKSITTINYIPPVPLWSYSKVFPCLRQVESIYIPEQPSFCKSSNPVIGGGGKTKKSIYKSWIKSWMKWRDVPSDGSSASWIRYLWMRNVSLEQVFIGVSFRPRVSVINEWRMDEGQQNTIFCRRRPRKHIFND